MKLKDLTILKYRSIKPGTTLRFNDGMNVLLGQNATGKTTLLNLISKCVNWSSVINEELDIEYVMSVKVLPDADTIITVKIQSQKQRYERALPELAPQAEKPNFQITSKITIASPDNQSLSITQELNSIQIYLKDNLIFPTTTIIINKWSVFNVLGEVLKFLFLDKKDFRNEAGIIFDTIVVFYAAKHAFRFDESLDMFHSITMPEYANPQAGGNCFTPELTITKRINGPTSTKIFIPNNVEVDPAQFSNEIFDIRWNEIPILSDAFKVMGFETGYISMQLKKKEIFDSNMEQYTFSALRFWLTRKDSSGISHQDLSYGQKRLLAFYYYLALNPEIVIADELVNGLHHEWIEKCLEAMKPRQSFLTSQNPLLLDYMTFNSVEDAESSFIVCKTHEEGGKAVMEWRNISNDEASAFYDAYTTGVQHVGEIMRTRGLW